MRDSTVTPRKDTKKIPKSIFSSDLSESPCLNTERTSFKKFKILITLKLEHWNLKLALKVPDRASQY